MRTPINFNDHFFLYANKVNDIGTNGMLSTKI